MNNNRISKFEKYLSNALLFIGLGIFLLLCMRIWSFTIDDAYISFRYAQNFALGEGLSWNIGEDPVEGFTSFFHVVLLGLLRFLDIDLVVAGKFVGLLASLAIALMIFARGVNAPGAKLAAALSVFLFLIAPATALHTVSGLETALFSLCLVCLLSLSCALLETKEQPSVMLYGLFGITGLLTGMTRPEGVLLFGIMLLYILIRNKHFLSSSVLLTLFMSYLMPAIVYMIWRYFYFGHLLPNTFYVKSLVARKDAMITIQSWNYVKEFLLFYANIYLVTFLYRLVRKSLTHFEVLAFTVLAIFSVFYLTVDTSIMGYLYRFLYPIFPFMLFALAFSLAQVFKEWELKPFLKYICTLLILLLSSCPLWKGGDNDTLLWWSDSYARSLEDTHAEIGQVLAQAELQGTLVMGDVGVGPYLAEKWSVVDYGHLNDEYLAHNGFEVDYFYRRNPDVFVFTNYDTNLLTEYYAMEISKDARFEDYQLVAKFKFQPNYYQFVFVKNEAKWESLRNAFKEIMAKREVDLDFTKANVIEVGEGVAALTGVSYPEGLFIEGAKITSRDFVIALKVTKQLSKTYKVFLHAYDANSKNLIKLYDFYPSVPLDMMKIGVVYPSKVTFEKPLTSDRVFHLGFFDEKDSSYPRLKNEDGQDTMLFKYGHTKENLDQ